MEDMFAAIPDTDEALGDAVAILCAVLDEVDDRDELSFIEGILLHLAQDWVHYDEEEVERVSETLPESVDLLTATMDVFPTNT